MLELQHIHKDYLVDKKPFTAIKDLNLVFPDKGFIAILGPSGCGKTTLLNIIGGLDHYTSGDLLIDGRSTKDFKDRDWDAYRNKRIGFVFQTYNLIPHYSILQNVEISLMLNGSKKADREKKAAKVLDAVGLGDVTKKRPNQLSGGQMQRVAIARALVNDPEIILADEPTGALDSVTSVQVLDLIKKVGKDRCVIMVTHNKELATKYADRIIQMKDGEIVSDSAPIEPSNKAPVGRETNKKTSMSFLTAITSSGQSILTKKARTMLTAVACSFGIIGVALVLATRNGFSNYVSNVETGVASSVPITISPTIYTYNTEEIGNKDDYPDNDNVYVNDVETETYASHRNNYDSTYFEYINKCLPGSGDKDHEGLASDIIYNRSGLNFHFLTEDGINNPSTIKSVNQYSSAGSVSSAVGSFTSLPTTVMHEIYGTEKYDVVYGKMPTESNEFVLIIDKYNQVSLTTLQKVGIVKENEKPTKISFQDIVYDGEGDASYKEYKCYKNSDYYQVNDETNLKTRGTYDSWKISDYVEGSTAEKNTLDLSIKVSDTDTVSMKFAKEATKSAVKFYQAPTTYAGCYNDDEKYNPITCKIVGVIRPSTSSYITMMPSSVGFLSSLKDEMASDYADGQPGQKLVSLQKTNYFIHRDTNNDTDLVANDGDGLRVLANNLSKLTTTTTNADGTTSISLSTDSVSSTFSGVYWYFASYSYDQLDYPSSSGGFSSYMNYMHAVGAEFSENGESLKALPDSMGDLADLILNPSFLNGGLFKYLAYYSSYSVINSILIFPASLTTKDALRSYLDAWNTGKADTETIEYSDIMSDFTSSLGIMIDVISAVLIVFASISLVVSSVMTAIITYVSVIERTKEIGILRSCGARKKDVGRLFEAECVITGLVAGVIGVLFSMLLCIPINQILDHLYPGNGLDSIASLNPWHALILVALSVVLAFISGFIPSRIAANKDPVTCLRSE